MKKLPLKNKSIALLTSVLAGLGVSYVLLAGLLGRSPATYASPVSVPNIPENACYVKSIQAALTNDPAYAVDIARWQFNLCKATAPFQYRYAYLEIPEGDSYYNPKPRVDGRPMVITARVRNIINEQLYGDGCFQVLDIATGDQPGDACFEIPLGRIPAGSTSAYRISNSAPNQMSLTTPDTINLFNVSFEDSSTGKSRLVKTIAIHIVQ